MPLQNRVSPFNVLEAVPQRGLLMGNRGILHDADQRVGESGWKHKRWVCCVLSFKGRKRKLMAPGRYTELFFLDEAVSLAAGHRPCKECRKLAFESFAAAWRRANDIGELEKVGAGDIDAALHLSRVAPRRKQTRFVSILGDLPGGAMFSFPDEPHQAWLVWGGSIKRWTHDGYVEAHTPDPLSSVNVITPLRTVEVLSAGYKPDVHTSAIRRGNPTFTT